jgi:hypothetical protein
MKHTVCKLVWNFGEGGIPYHTNDGRLHGQIAWFEMVWEPRNPRGAMGHAYIRFSGEAVSAPVLHYLRTELGVRCDTTKNELRISVAPTHGEPFHRTAAKFALQLFRLLGISTEHVPTAPRYTYVDLDKGWREFGAHTWESVLAEELGRP